MTVLHDGQHVQLVRRHGWEFLNRKNCHGIVAILAVTDNDEIILVEQFREPLQQSIIETPAGLVDVGENAIAAAHRELQEETGYRAKFIEILAENVPLSPGATSETITLVKASGLTQVNEGGGIPGEEDIIVHTIPLQSVREWLKNNDLLIQSTVYSVLYFIPQK